MKIKRVAAIIFTIAIICIPVFAQKKKKLDFTVLPGTDFSRYRTYKWQRAEKAIYPEPALDQMFIRTIESELVKKGFQRIESGEPDVFVTYQIAVFDDMEWSSAQTTIPWGGLAGINPGISGAVVSSTNMIKKGSFIFDLYDVKERRRVWQVIARKTLANTTDINKREKNLQKIMAEIMTNYPPR